MMIYNKKRVQRLTMLLALLASLAGCGGGSTSTDTRSDSSHSSDNRSDNNDSHNNSSDNNNTDNTDGNNTGNNTDGNNTGNNTGNNPGNSNSGNTNTGGTNTGGTNTNGKGYSLLAWNDLGMHCMDSDYSIFSILPPYNTVNAQLVIDGNVVTQGVSLTYESSADPSGSINTFSAGKTSFWTHAKDLFGITLPAETGLTGLKSASKTPQAMTFNQENQWFEAVGIPLTPLDDAGKTNAYPMMKITAKDTTGKELASARIVTPVSSEMNCQSCHASTTNMTFSAEAEPQAGWVFDPDPEHDFRRNILRLHDEKESGSSQYTNALQAQGYHAAGLLATADSGKPILCAGCHASNALPGTGVAGIPPLTQVLHSTHGKVDDPATGKPLDASTDRSACYSCHPGSNTQCLRGAMGTATDGRGHSLISCQSCHGNLSQVGSSTRQGWFDEPNCQSCHYDGKREVSALTAGGDLRQVSDTRFATNDNTPAAGISLFRFSSGHGGVQCEGCHGSTHAIFPSGKLSDNIYSTDLQGHAGTISECTTCHANTPNTSTGGPHGMHSVGQWWVGAHEDVAERNATQCAACHGADYRGSPLSTVTATRTLNADGRSKTFQVGHQVSCYDCHNGPSGD